MNEIFARAYFDSICQCLYDSNLDVSAGLDRVTADNFMRRADENYDIICRKMSACTYRFTKFKQVEVNNRKIYIPTCRDRVVSEYMKNNLKLKYHIYMKSRDKITKELRTILSECVDYYVIRLDVKSFFDNINHGKLLEKLRKDNLCSLCEYQLIHNLLKTYGEKGVPQGIGVSNYLSEIYMKSFDIYMSRLNANIFYYARYVDDIILIIPGIPNDLEKEQIKSCIESIFENNKLIQNNTKSKYIDFTRTNNGFDYLGYNFKKINKKLIVNISQEKKKKIKTRIKFMMEDYIKNGEYILLRERLKNLISIHELYKAKSAICDDYTVRYYKTRCQYGTKYDYGMASDDSFEELNKCIRYWVKNIGITDRKQKRELLSLQFPVGDKKAVNYNASYVSISSYRSLIYAMSGRSISWLDLRSMSKNSLTVEYNRLIEGI